MAKLFVVMGKSASGKDTIFKELCKDEELSLKQIVPYTTRPIREGEKEGIEYHFVDQKRLEELRNENKIIEERAYNTAHGIWNYFTVDDGQINLTKHNYIVIGTLESYLQIRSYYGEASIVPIYIEVETGERLQRALDRERMQRSPKYIELCRRYIADEEDFAKEKLEVAGIQTIYENLNLQQCLGKIKSEIKRHC